MNECICKRESIPWQPGLQRTNRLGVRTLNAPERFGQHFPLHSIQDGGPATPFGWTLENRAS